MSDPGWISDPQLSINDLLDRRLGNDPGSEYLEVCAEPIAYSPTVPDARTAP